MKNILTQKFNAGRAKKRVAELDRDIKKYRAEREELNKKIETLIKDLRAKRNKLTRRINILETDLNSTKKKLDCWVKACEIFDKMIGGKK